MAKVSIVNFFTLPTTGVRCIVICMSVCLSVCLSAGLFVCLLAYLKSHASKFHQVSPNQWHKIFMGKKPFFSPNYQCNSTEEHYNYAENDTQEQSTQTYSNSHSRSLSSIKRS